MFYQILLLLLLYDTGGGVWSHRVDLVERFHIRIPHAPRHFVQVISPTSPSPIRTYPLFHEILLLLLLYDTRGGVWSHRVDLVECLDIRIPQTIATLYKLSHQPHPHPIRTYPLFHEILLLLLLLYDTGGGVRSHRIDLVECLHIRIPHTPHHLVQVISPTSPSPIRTYPLFYQILLLLLLLYDTGGGVWSHRIDLVECLHIRISHTSHHLVQVISPTSLSPIRTYPLFYQILLLLLLNDTGCGVRSHWVNLVECLHIRIPHAPCYLVQVILPTPPSPH